MASKNRSALQDTLIVKALFMYTMMHCAPNLRATKPDLLGMYNDIMHDRDIVALLKKCNMTPQRKVCSCRSITFSCMCNQARASFGMFF